LLAGDRSRPACAMDVAELLRRVEDLEESGDNLRQDCDDYRRMAYESDLRLRDLVTRLGDSLRSEGSALRETVERVAALVDTDQAGRGTELQRLEARLAQQVQAGTNRLEGQAAQQLTPLLAEHAARIEANEVTFELQASMQQLALEKQAGSISQLSTKLDKVAHQQLELETAIESAVGASGDLFALVEQQAEAQAETREQVQNPHWPAHSTAYTTYLTGRGVYVSLASRGAGGGTAAARRCPRGGTAAAQGAFGEAGGAHQLARGAAPRAHRPSPAARSECDHSGHGL
jgi:hypothetical protein